MAPRKIEKITKKEEKPFSLFTFETQPSSIIHDWTQNINWKLSLKAAFNVIFITEILSAQLILINDMTTQKAMQGEIHRHIAKLLSLPEINSLLTMIAVEETNQYAEIFLNKDIVERFNDIDSKRITVNPKYKGVQPWPGMPKDLLNKFTLGRIFSLRGTMTTHPLYYANDLVKHYKISDLEKISLNQLKKLTEFPEEFNLAIKFIQGKIKGANPFSINVAFSPTILQEELGYIIHSNTPNKEVELFEENYEDLTPDEIERLKKLNQTI